MDDRTIEGRRLRVLREQAGLHLPELARAAGCSVGHLKNIETARSPEARARNQPSGALTYRLLRELSRHLNREISIDEITSDSDPAEPVAA